MFAAKQNILPFYDKMLQVDQDYEAEAKIRAARSITEKALSGLAFEVDGEAEARWLRGFEVNEGLSGEDFYLALCLDLHSVELSGYGREVLIDYLADKLHEYFRFALRQLGEM